MSNEATFYNSDLPIPKLPPANAFPHYYKKVEHLKHVDVYRVLQLFQVTDPCLQHAVKKLLVAGGRGPKDPIKDVHEAIATLERFLEMRFEDPGAPL